jgi:hypothetical protein
MLRIDACATVSMSWIRGMVEASFLVLTLRDLTRALNRLESSAPMIRTTNADKREYEGPVIGAATVTWQMGGHDLERSFEASPTLIAEASDDNRLGRESYPPMGPGDGRCSRRRPYENDNWSTPYTICC